LAIQKSLIFLGLLKNGLAAHLTSGDKKYKKTRLV